MTHDAVNILKKTVKTIQMHSCHTLCVCVCVSLHK